MKNALPVWMNQQHYTQSSSMQKKSTISSYLGLYYILRVVEMMTDIRLSMCYLYFIISAALVFVRVHGQSCGGIGTSSGELVPNRMQGFYLNIQDPAPCNGTIDEFQYCYYHTEQDGADSYVFAPALFRETSSGVYRRVTSPYTAERSRDSFGSQSFTCVYENISVKVQVGDVIGACIFDFGRHNTQVDQLDLVGQGNSSESDRYLMMADVSRCADILLVNNQVVELSSLSRVDFLVLHIFANIGASMVTGAPPTTSLATETTESGASIFTGAPPTTSIAMETTESGTSFTRRGTSGTPPNTSPVMETADSGNDSVTTTLPTESLPQGDDTGVIAAVLVILIVAITATIVIVIAVIVVKKRRRSKEALGEFNRNQAAIRYGIDNAVYFANEEPHCSHSAILDTTQTLTGSEECHEVEHTYEYAVINSISELPHYAELESLQDVANPLDTSAIDNRKLLELNKSEDIYSHVNSYEVPASHENDIYAQLSTWKVPCIPQNEVEVASHLGSGQFGSVERGVWKRQGTRPVDVALKSLTKTSEEDKVKFLQEAAIMAQFRHPNVIMLYGMIINGNPIMIVEELAERGDLRKYLLSISPSDSDSDALDGTAAMLLKFSQQVALGMQYLSAKGFVHRDLAARNILLTNDGICKVADFGMSRDLAKESYYVSRGGIIPVKWTAPEALHYKKYSTASDVWSYGCLLYEIWSLGHKPFEKHKNTEVLQLVDAGKRLPPPPGIPRTVYELMVNCWHPETSQRPSFRDIVLTLVGSEEMVLNIPEEDSSTNPLAGVLGAPLEAGENMYSVLQRRYIQVS